MSIKTEFRQKDFTPVGLEDGGHNILSCSNCGKELADVWVTTKADIKTTFRANCPFCGDKSFLKEVSGLCHIGCVENTVIENFDTNKDGIVNILVRKGS